MEIARTANLGLTFLLELCMLAAFAFWGFATGNGLAIQVLLGVGTPILVAVIWGIFMAPRSSRRLGKSAHQVVELVIFGLAFVALYAAGQPVLTAIFAVVFAINFILRLVWE
jgi:hypothetical protein